MTAETIALVKAGALAIAAFLFLIGGFLDPSSYDTTVTMWGIAFALVTLTFLLDHMPSIKIGQRGGSM